MFGPTQSPDYRIKRRCDKFHLLLQFTSCHLWTRTSRIKSKWHIDIHSLVKQKSWPITFYNQMPTRRWGTQTSRFGKECIQVNKWIKRLAQWDSMVWMQSLDVDLRHPRVWIGSADDSGSEYRLQRFLPRPCMQRASKWPDLSNSSSWVVLIGILQTTYMRATTTMGFYSLSPSREQQPRKENVAKTVSNSSINYYSFAFL